MGFWFILNTVSNSSTFMRLSQRLPWIMILLVGKDSADFCHKSQITFLYNYRKKSNWRQMQPTLLENTDITNMWIKADSYKPHNHRKWGFWPLMLPHIRKKKKKKKLCLTMRNVLMRLERTLNCNNKKKWTRIMWDPLNAYIFTKPLV